MKDNDALMWESIEAGVVLVVGKGLDMLGTTLAGGSGGVNGDIVCRCETILSDEYV